MGLLVAAAAVGGLYALGAAVAAFWLRHAGHKPAELARLALVWPILLLACLFWKA